MSNRSLDQWLTWLETLHPSEMDLGLLRIRQVAEKLDLHRPNSKVITVAGTNGKGSFVCVLSHLISLAQHSVGTYTSPHIEKFNERIQVNGKDVSDALLCDAFLAIDNARGDISLTYFEFSTLAALYIFKQLSLEYIVLEVGLGGRLDAVNLIDADIAVITSIAIDHESWLGNSREDIGFEKAGICRPVTPLICADPEPPLSVINMAQHLSCSLLTINQDFDIDTRGNSSTIRYGSLKQSLELDTCFLPLPSVAAALECSVQLGFRYDSAQLKSAVESLRLAGRYEQSTLAEIPVVMDVAHNPAAAEFLAQRLKREQSKSEIEKPVAMIVSLMSDKDLAGVLSPLIPYVDYWYCCDLVGNPRAAKASDLKKILIESHSIDPLRVKCHEYVLGACNEILNESVSFEKLLVVGSFFLVSEFKSMKKALSLDESL